MDEQALLACVAWAAFGFEIMQSLFLGWHFRAPDTVAAFGLHGALFVGEPTSVTPGSEAEWLEALRQFDTQLQRDGAGYRDRARDECLRGRAIGGAAARGRGASE
jgi:2-oxo-3-hexenedioate decarboxylase